MGKSIQLKFVFWAGLSLVITALTIIILSSVMLRSSAIEAAKRNALETARTQANLIDKDIDTAFHIARTIHQMVASSVTQDAELSREQVNAMLYETFINNTNLIGTWSLWESNAFDELDAEYINTVGHDETGRFVVYWNRDAEGNISREPVTDYSGDWYEVPKATLKETITDPYIYTVQGKDTLLTSVVIPMVINNEFYGLTGVDFSLDHLQTSVTNLNIISEMNAEATLINNYGTIIASSKNPDAIGKSLEEFSSDSSAQMAIITQQQEILRDQDGFVSVFEPITPGFSDMPWTLNLSIPIDVIIQQATTLTLQLVGAGALMTILGLILLWFVARQIARPIKAMTTVAEDIINGDLGREVEITTKDETGVLARAFNEMIAKLRNMIKDEQKQRQSLQETVSLYTQHMARISQGNLKEFLDIQENSDDDNPIISLGHNLNDMTINLQSAINQMKQASDSLNSAGLEIQQAVVQQNAAVVEQDATITQTVTTVEELRSTLQTTAKRAQTVSQASQQSLQVSQQGQEAVEATIEGMQNIRERVQNIAETILMLSEHTQQIGSITTTVNEIAEQSKLLALNASIEAARAGDEGKGFAVVAMEVRQLAEQSRSATLRIQEILNQIQHATNTAVMVTEEGSKGTETGMTLVQSAGEAIQKLSHVIEQSAQNALEIAASTSQQTSGIDQLAVAIAQIKEASLQATNSIQQTEQSIRDLNTVAKTLETVTQIYQL